MSEEVIEVWDGLRDNNTPGRLGEPSPEETLSQETDSEALGFDGSPSHRGLEESPAIRAAGGAHKPVQERKNDTSCYAFAVVNPAAAQEIVASDTLPPGVYEVSLFIRSTVAGVSRTNAQILQQDLSVGTVLIDASQVPPMIFPRVTIRQGERIRVVTIAADGATTYFGQMIVTLRESYGR